jgi:glycosyltransferase involved in cell wall biosynthesis
LTAPMPGTGVDQPAPLADRTEPKLEDRVDIAVIAGVRFTTAEPHAGGLERHTDTLARHLVAAGHRVTVHAGSGADDVDAGLPYDVEPLVDEPIELSPTARRDVSMPPEQFMVEHDAYLSLDRRLRRRCPDVIHNNSLHYLPVVADHAAATVHTLHTPPTPWLESAHRVRRSCAVTDELLDSTLSTQVVSVSRHNAEAWGDVVDRVVPNGIDLGRWPMGAGERGDVVWAGRLVPEKAPHLAIDAARRAGRPILLTGPRHDVEYFDAEIAPRLGAAADWLGHCRVEELASLIGGAAVALVTPRWDEPFGLVVAEALACGTPVAGLNRGALPELVDDSTGILVADGDLDSLAAAIDEAAGLSRVRCREAAVRRFSAAAMTEAYLRCYHELRGTSRVTSIATAATSSAASASVTKWCEVDNATTTTTAG